MTTESQMVRQGDVLVTAISHGEIQGDLIPNNGKLVLAEGEATGHAHAIHSSSAKMFRDGQGQIFLDLTNKEEVVHEEHDSLWLQAGAYRVIGQREYSPEAIRRVAD